MHTGPQCCPQPQSVSEKTPFGGGKLSKMSGVQAGRGPHPGGNPPAVNNLHSRPGRPCLPTPRRVFTPLQTGDVPESSAQVETRLRPTQPLTARQGLLPPRCCELQGGGPGGEVHGAPRQPLPWAHELRTQSRAVRGCKSGTRHPGGPQGRGASRLSVAPASQQARMDELLSAPV